MKLRTEKGQGGHTALQLNAEQKVALTLWIHQNEDLCERLQSSELANAFKEQSGITVSTSSILTTRNAVFPRMKRARKIANSDDGTPHLFIEKMNQLHARISRIESELGMLPLL